MGIRESNLVAMMEGQPFKLSGTARPQDAAAMLETICAHFIEHAEVARGEGFAVLTSRLGIAEIRISGQDLAIGLACPSQPMLDLTRTVIAEHLFEFAAGNPFELAWAQTPPTALPHLREVTVASVEDITPHMRRVRFSCADITPFVGGDMHVRLLVPPKGRTPVWPRYREDGRVAWPEGDDALLVRIYTIRAVDIERGELLVDFLQHPMEGVATPGADFARDVEPGTVVALMGPGGGRLPDAKSILIGGDESALPAIARMLAEVPAGTNVTVMVEVANAAEEQLMPSAGNVTLRWLHRDIYPAEASLTLSGDMVAAIETMAEDTFVWFACETADVRVVRSLLKKRRHNKERMYIARYWERGKGGEE